MILVVVTLMVTHHLGALPVRWGPSWALSRHNLSTPPAPSPEFYKVGAMTVPIPQMETLRLREETWARSYN